ncbi:heat shock protein beta-1 [Solea solea]|uniref:heat shock protein beta-1 n=1 Tax=Solea solea TaxID=90069 RepID=UPI00272D35B8|nr:heat shock protein beta-1 [Solea solea]
MSQQAKTEPSHGGYSRCGPGYPLRKWWLSSRLFNQDVGLPPFLEPGVPWWRNIDWFQRSLATSAWPGYIPAPLYVPYISGSTHQTSQTISKEPCKWRVILDVAHFSPSEISLSVKDGFLVVGGKHEERQDEHGFIARSFTRKYRLPDEIDGTKITSTLSVDGILTMEAPVPEASVPAATIIPIKLEMEATGEQEEKREEEETPEKDSDSSRGAEATDCVCAEDHEVESPLEAHSDQVQPDSATDDLQQHEERGEQEQQEEEIHAKIAGEAHPSVSAEILQDSSKQHEDLENQENPDTDVSKQPEHKEPATNGEIQVMDPDHGSAEAAKEINLPEEQELGKGPLSEVTSQELETPDIKQEEHTE